MSLLLFWREDSFQHDQEEIDFLLSRYKNTLTIRVPRGNRIRFQKIHTIKFMVKKQHTTCQELSV